jgi:hypothetical protein
VGFDAVFEPDQRTQVVDSGLAGRATTGGWQVGLGVVKVHPSGSGCVGEAAGWHVQEHGFADPSRYLIAVHWWAVLRVDDRLHLDLTGGVGEEPAHLVEGHGPDSFEAGGAAQPSSMFGTRQRLLSQYLAVGMVQIRPVRRQLNQGAFRFRIWR